MAREAVSIQTQLFHLLKSSNALEKVRAAKALLTAFPNDPTVHTVLMKVIKESHSDTLRDEAIRNLQEAHFNKFESLDHYSELVSDPNPKVREVAATLANKIPTNLLAALQKATPLLKDADPGVKRAIVATIVQDPQKVSFYGDFIKNLIKKAHDPRKIVYLLPFFSLLKSTGPKLIQACSLF